MSFFRKHPRVLIAGILLFLFSLGVIFFQSRPIESLFKIEAVTEFIEYQHADSVDNRFSIYNAKLLHQDALMDFSGSVKICNGAKVTFSRIGIGELLMDISGEQGDTIAYFYSYRSSMTNLKNRKGVRDVTIKEDTLIYAIENISASIQAKDLNDSIKQSMLIPIRGVIKIGHTINSVIFNSNEGILQSGKIGVSVKTSSSGTYEERITHDLQVGDEIIFDECSNDNVVDEYKGGLGLLVINEDFGMKLSYRVLADECIIIKPGPRENDDPGYKITSTAFDFLFHNAVVRNIILILSIVVTFATIIDFYFEHLLNKYIKNKEDETP